MMMMMIVSNVVAERHSLGEVVGKESTFLDGQGVKTMMKMLQTMTMIVMMVMKRGGGASA